jgi:hypothetical protein
MNLSKYDYLFLVVLLIGSIARFISTIIVPLNPDANIYIVSARTILNYASYRPPVFPFFIAVFSLITGNEGLAINLTSLIAGILLLLYSYKIFTKASLKLYQNKKNWINNAKLTGLITSSLIALNLYLVYNNGRGLREELISFLCLLVFYYAVIKEEANYKNIIYLFLTVFILTLTHLTFGLFIAIGVLMFTIIPKLKFINIEEPSYKKLLIVMISFISSFTFWALYSLYKAGDPFFNWHYHSLAFDFIYNIDLSTIDGIIKALFSGLIFGIPYEFYHLFILLGIVLTLISVYLLIKNIKNLQFFFIFIVVGINFLYLSIFMAIPGDPRLILPFFPFFLYLSGICLTNVIKESKRIKEKRSNISILYFLIISFFVTYVLRGIYNLNLTLNPIIALLSLVFLVINEIITFFIIYLSRDKDFFRLNEEI